MGRAGRPDLVPSFTIMSSVYCWLAVNVRPPGYAGLTILMKRVAGDECCCCCVRC